MLTSLIFCYVFISVDLIHSLVSFRKSLDAIEIAVLSMGAPRTIVVGPRLFRFHLQVIQLHAFACYA